jgi:hypothetical protein
MGDDDEVLLRAPMNAQRAPASRNASRSAGSQEPLVLIRLQWPSRTEVRPAKVILTTHSLAQVEWQSRPGAKPRRTWLRRSDVRHSMHW